ncbi:Uncharacterised protein [Yersinia frederiksenii]|nr:hypothetical protein [Yersinia frederiksenii]CNK94405.1 Uncharacterised protein [Yersinia frederiksenii]
MYQRIRTALTTEGSRVNSASIFLGSAAECYYCPSCHNPLQLQHTHVAGRLFIHDQEHPDFNPDINCKYRAKMASTSSQTTDTLSNLGFDAQGNLMVIAQTAFRRIQELLALGACLWPSIIMLA